MSTVVVTGAHGLVGSEAVAWFCERGHDVVGIDNDMRARFFGVDASTAWQGARLVSAYPKYRAVDADIRDLSAIERVFEDYSSSIDLVVHTAAQPSHDWAAREPFTDFTVNANGTLLLLECTRRLASNATFIFTSTNKVYGDRPNELPLVELDRRWEIDPSHAYREGVPEDMSLDQTTHSLFGASKVAADLLVQEYGRYFGSRPECFEAVASRGPRTPERNCTVSWPTWSNAWYRARHIGYSDTTESKSETTFTATISLTPFGISTSTREWGKSTTSGAAGIVTVRSWKPSHSVRRLPGNG